MGFLTRLLAGLTAAAALGTGLAGTANAVDVTGAAGTTKSVVKLADDGGNETSEDTADNPDDDSTDADSTTDAGAQSDAGQQAEIQSSTSQDKATAKSSLPDHIVNGSFDYPACPDGKNSCDVDPTTGWGGFYVDYGRKFMPIPDWNRSKFGWDSSQEGLRPDQQPNSHQKLQHCVQIGNKPNNNGQKMNRFAEIIAETPDEYIYQDIATTPGVMYRWSLKHASEDASHVDSMQVMIGSPGRETAQDATRTTSNGRGDRTGVTSKTIATKGGQAEWETYTGVYVATSTVTRFTFKSAQGRDSTRGNFIDDVMFTKAYKLTYDKNSADASGQVPSNQRGKENTTQPARTKTNGKIRLASDTSKLSDHLVNSDFEYLPDGGWKTVDAPSYMRNAYTSVDPNNGQYMRNAKHVDADLASWVDWPGFDQSKFAWRTDQKGGQDQGGLKDRANAVELQQDSTDGNTYAEIVASETGRTIYQDLATIPGTLYKIRLKHASLCKDNVDKMQVVINGTPIEMTRVTANGKAGDKVGEKSTTIGTRVTNENRWHHADQWETYEGYYVIPDGQTITRFGFKAVNYLDPTKGNLLDDVTFARAYKLSYDKNSTDATGEVPSNQRGKENTTQPAKTKTSGTVKTVADTNASLPDHLVNGDFEYPGANVLNNKGDWWGVSRKDRMVFAPQPRWVSLPSTFDSDRFAWDSTEVARVQNESSQWHTNEVELQRDSRTGNMYAELCAYQAHTSIHQYIHTTPGTLYKVRLKHASLSRDYLDKMQVLIGPDGNEQPVRMTRVESQNGLDATGKATASTTVSTHASNEMEIKDGQGGPYSSRNHDGQWATYEGVYVATSDVTSFTFKSVDSKQYNLGNLLDDIVFDKAYRLSYDKNATDANGSVPSDETAGATKQAKAGTTGALRLASDDDVATYAASNLPKQLVNSDFDHDWRNIVSQSKMSAKYNFANIDPAHGDVEISGALNSKGEASKHWVHLNGFDAARFGWKSNQTDTRVDGRGGIVEIQRSKANDNMYAEITASQANTYLYQDIDTAHDYPTVYTVKLRYAHRNGTINSNEKIQILVGAPGHEQPVEMTRIASDRGNRLGEKSTTVNAPNTDGWLGSWDTFQGSVVVPAGQNVSRFTFKALGSIDGVSGNLIDDVQFKLAYKLSYDKNAQDASGQVPSNETANTVKQTKAKTTGSVRLAAESSKTDGKVSDLVQRTTTHEDGSVTVRTVDQSTDVVSGCQVYYPAGQRITLATMAKDDDCWDSSMLSRPGHTQLGWNQDRNATQAQAEVTMVEGGMTVFAVWVGNPVLTYDTNKPSTWSGQMPSTPASVSVAYNTAAADGSGWRAGDVSKIRGYRFLGWYTGPQDDAGLYDWNTLLTGNVTVYAHWQRLQANVIYNANGGTGSHANTTGWQYSDVTIPSDTSKSFTRTGYRFTGWNTAKDGKGTAYKDGSQVPLQAGDVTLYAQWKPLFDVLPSAGGDYGPTVPWLVCGGLALIALAGGVASTLLRLRRARGAHSR